MTIFQKLIIMTLIIFGSSGMFFFSQHKKDELEFQKLQQKVTDCKYLLSNKDKIKRPVGEILDEWESALETKAIEDLEEVRQQESSISSKYLKSAASCREFLLQTGY